MRLSSRGPVARPSIHVATIQQTDPGRLLLVQLDCDTATLAAHLRARDTPVPDEWAARFHDAWRSVELPNALKISVNNQTPSQVTEQILDSWYQPRDSR